MMDIVNIIKESFFWGVDALKSAAIFLMSWGHRGVSWIRSKCGCEQKVDAVFQRTNLSDKIPLKGEWWKQVPQCKEVSKEWRHLGGKKARELAFSRIVSHFIRSSTSLEVSEPSSRYGNFLGSVHGVPGNFGLWMPGVALIASYLVEKKKVSGLYVCDSLETLSAQIREISRSPLDQRSAFVVGTFQSGFKQQLFGFEPNFPQHKVTVCVEKKDGELTIALLDPEPMPGSNLEISPDHLTDDIWAGYDKWDQFNNQELAFRAILKACHAEGCKARLLHSRVLRETSYGCTVFALQDALTYLKDVDFFDKIGCSEEFSVKVDRQYTIEAITRLPSECMIGAQSSRVIEEFRRQGGVFDASLIGRKKTLQGYLSRYRLEVPDQNGSLKSQNHYITKKAFKYLHLAIASLTHLNLESIQHLINKTYLQTAPGPILLKQAESRRMYCSMDRDEERGLELESYRETAESVRRLVV